MGSGKSPSRRADAPAPLRDSNLARTIANPWRSRILGELYLRPLSPSQFVEEVGGEISTIARHFRYLAKHGYIEIVDEKSGGRRRGGVEHIYRTTQRDQLDSDAWATLPLEARKEWSRNSIAFFFRRITEAVEADTFDSETDRHFSWDAVSLDRIAWKEVTDRLDELLAWLPELEAESAQRLGSSEEEPIFATVGLSAFRSPTSSEVRKKGEPDS
jgi:DNA-binding transcriptional ArsR family regulator